MKSVLIGSVLSVAAVAVAISAAVHFTNYDNRQLTSFSDTVSSNVSDNREQHIVDTVTRSKVFDGSFRSELTEAEQVVYDAMVQHYVVERKSNEDRLYIDAAAIGVGQPGFRIGDTLRIAYEAFKQDHPEAFWATYETFDVQYDSNHDIESVSPRMTEFEGKYSDAETVFRGIDEAVETIRQMRKSESRYDTVKAIHDYICQTVEYDSDTYRDGEFHDIVQEAFTLAPAFGGGPRKYRIVCEGYAKTFKALCSRFDISCVSIGDLVLPHEWNLVQMDDGMWYGVDVAWDDVRNSQPRYDYFLVGRNTPCMKGNHDPVEVVFYKDNSAEPVLFNPASFAEEKYNPGKSV